MNRRECLGALCGGAAGLGLGAAGSCLCSLSGEAMAAPLQLGHLSELVGGEGARDYPGPAVAVVWTRQGLLFLQTRCTHLGCKLRLVGREWVCPCHGGRFSLEGARRGGPPRQPLRALRGEVGASGELLVYPGEENRERRPLPPR